MFKNLVIIFLFISIKTFAQTPNIGFEDGSFNNWTCYAGNIDSLGVISVSQTSPIYNRHTIISKESGTPLDPYGKFPMLCPNGGKYSVRLGNSDTVHQAERLTYTFTVPNQKSYSIVFNYAVVLENPGHAPYQQPKFTARVYDISNNAYIPCPSFDFTASSSLPGFKLSTERGLKGDGVFYKDWSTTAIDLSNYIGDVIRLEFTTNDCTRGQHFGYAYLDINEDNGAAIAGNSYCAGQTSMTLYGPNGFASYAWYNADHTKLIGTSQSLRISPPPPDNTEYSLEVFPYAGVGCADVLHTIVKRIDEGFTLNVVDTVFGCPDKGVDLTDPKVTAGTSPGTTLSYFTDLLGTSYLYNPNQILNSGKYYIQGINKEGCMNILPVNVSISLPQISITDPTPVTFPVTVDLSKTYTHLPNQTYSYYTDAAASAPVEDYANIRYGAVYYIKTESKYGCVTIAPVNVVIYPPPPYKIIAPNTFTPNGDGINDHFGVSIDGEATFKNLRIFNRYGHLVYNSTSVMDYWDGSFKGSVLPVGVYYWLLNGLDNYSQTEFTKSAFITLLR